MRDFPLHQPGKLIAAIPAVLGFVPEKSLVLVTIDGGEMGCVMRVDLIDDVCRIDRPDGGGGRRERSRGGDRGDRRRGRGSVPDVQRRSPRTGRRSRRRAGRGRHRCCAAPTSSTGWRQAAGGTARTAAATTGRSRIRRPRRMAAAAVLDGRRLYTRRAELQEVIAVADPVRTATLRGVIDRRRGVVRRRPAPAGRGPRATSEHAMAAASGCDRGAVPIRRRPGAAGVRR